MNFENFNLTEPFNVLTCSKSQIITIVNSKLLPGLVLPSNGRVWNILLNDLLYTDHNETTSTNPKVHITLPPEENWEIVQATVQKTLYGLGMFSEICRWTYRHTHILVSLLCSPTSLPTSPKHHNYWGQWLHDLTVQISVWLSMHLWHCRLRVRKSIQPVKTEWWGVGVAICLERGADCLHMVQLMRHATASPNPIFSCLI